MAEKIAGFSDEWAAIQTRSPNFFGANYSYSWVLFSRQNIVNWKLYWNTFSIKTCTIIEEQKVKISVDKTHKVGSALNISV